MLDSCRYAGQALQMSSNNCRNSPSQKGLLLHIAVETSFESEGLPQRRYADSEN